MPTITATHTVRLTNPGFAGSPFLFTVTAGVVSLVLPDEILVIDALAVWFLITGTAAPATGPAASHRLVRKFAIRRIR